MVAVAHNFPSKSGTDAPLWRPLTPAGCAGGTIRLSSSPAYSSLGRIHPVTFLRSRGIVRSQRPRATPKNRAKNTDINNRARTLLGLGDISSWSGASSLLVRGHRFPTILSPVASPQAVRISGVASLNTHRQAARIATTRPPPPSTFWEQRDEQNGIQGLC